MGHPFFYFIFDWRARPRSYVYMLHTQYIMIWRKQDSTLMSTEHHHSTAFTVQHPKKKPKNDAVKTVELNEEKC